MNRFGLDYPTLELREAAARLRSYDTSARYHKERMLDLIDCLPAVAIDWIGESVDTAEATQVGQLSVLIIPASFRRFGADGLTMLADVPQQEGMLSPFPVVLANDALLGSDPSRRRVMVRHEAVHVEQVIRGDYLRFVSDVERRAISQDPTGILLAQAVFGGDRQTLVRFAGRRFLQDLYNEGEAYSREEIEFGHRVNFWEAWTDLFARAGDYYRRYSLREEFPSPGRWLASIEDEISSVMRHSRFFRTRYVEDGRVTFLRVLLESCDEGNSIIFRSGVSSLPDVLI